MLLGHNNIEENKRIRQERNKAKENKLKAQFKVTDSQAKYAYEKKLKKTGNVDKAKKAEQRVYLHSMMKGSGGLPGSISDVSSNNRASKYYDHLSKKKGKEYADKIEKKYKMRLGVGLAASAALYGASIYALYKDR